MKSLINEEELKILKICCEEPGPIKKIIHESGIEESKVSVILKN
jgi:hypothetical protein